MKVNTKEILDGSPAIRSTTIAYSDNFILTTNGVLNVYYNLTENDCKNILAINKLNQIQFSNVFNVSDKTFDLINSRLLDSEKKQYLRLTLNGYGAINDLSCLSQLPNLKALAVDMFKSNQIDKINQFTKLTSLSLGGSISLKPIVEQNELEELFLFEKLKDVEVIGSMTNLKAITFSKITLKNLDFLTNLHNLKELYFILGSAINYEKLPEIGKIEKLSFTWVRQLTIENLLPINKMKFLKKLEFDTQTHLTSLNWLTNKSIMTEVRNCKNFQKINHL